MNKLEALTAILDDLEDRDVAVFCNGITAREGYMLRDRPTNFYMLGSMGQARMIGIGVAQCLDRRVVVLDGDGNYLMNPGGPAPVGAAAPPNLMHVILDNGSYETTGGQPTLARSLDLAAIGRAFGYASARRVDAATELTSAFRAGLALDGAAMLVVDVTREAPDASRIIPLSPQEMAERFRAGVEACA